MRTQAERIEAAAVVWRQPDRSPRAIKLAGAHATAVRRRMTTEIAEVPAAVELQDCTVLRCAVPALTASAMTG
jgi:hypothetical protein